MHARQLHRWVMPCLFDRNDDHDRGTAVIRMYYSKEMSVFAQLDRWGDDDDVVIRQHRQFSQVLIIISNHIAQDSAQHLQRTTLNQGGESGQRE